MDRINTLGRRKTSVARIYMTSGKGEIKVNNRELTDYFPIRNPSNHRESNHLRKLSRMEILISK